MAGKSSGFSVYKVFRLFLLFGLIVAVFFGLKKPEPPAIPLPREQAAEQAKSFEAKLSNLEAAQQRGEAGGKAQFSSDEVNGFLSEATARASNPAPATASPTSADTGESAANATTQPTQRASSAENDARAQIKSTQVAFAGDEVIAQAVTERYGKDIYITVREHLGAEGGYLKFTPTGFKIGDLAVPASLVEGPLQKKLAEPETREKLKLPEFIADLRIENGQLIVVQK